MGFAEEKEVKPEVQEPMIEPGEVKESNGRLREVMGVFDDVEEMVSVVKEVRESNRTLREEMDEVINGQRQIIRFVEKLKTAIANETKTLNEKVRAIEDGTETLKENVGAIEGETKALEERVGAIKQEGKRVAMKIQDLRVDALTVQYDSFMERKAKYDHEGDEKLRTFLSAFFVFTVIAAWGSLRQQSSDLSKFHGWIFMALTVGMSLIFLPLGIYLFICIYDFISQAKNLKTEKERLESYFRSVAERNGDIEAGLLVDEHAAKKAQEQADCLQKMRVRVMPLLGVAGVIVVVIVFCLICQLIFVGKLFKLF